MNLENDLYIKISKIYEIIIHLRKVIRMKASYKFIAIIKIESLIKCSSLWLTKVRKSFMGLDI